MGLLTHLRLKMASLLLGPRETTSSLNMPLTNQLDPKQLEQLFSMLSTLLSMEQSSTSRMEISHPLIQRFHQARANEAEENWTSASSANLPHRIYAAQLAHDGMSWICKYGAPGEDPLLVGRGNNPAQAIDDFDNKWQGFGEDE